jgi:hypothetical protein
VVALRWTDQSLNETHFVVKRRQGDEGPFQSIGQVAAGVTQYFDSSAVAGSRYFYRVQAFSATERSINSNSVSMELAQASQPGGDAPPGQEGTAFTGIPLSLFLAWQRSFATPTGNATAEPRAVRVTARAIPPVRSALVDTALANLVFPAQPSLAPSNGGGMQGPTPVLSAPDRPDHGRPRVRSEWADEALSRSASLPGIAPR